MKILKWILIPLLIIVLIIGIAVVGVQIYVKNKYEISMFSTIGQLRRIGKPVDETQLITNGFSDADMVDVQALVNASVKDMIVYDADSGYIVNLGNLSGMVTKISLTDKQVGALANTIIEQEFNGQVENGGGDVGVELKQIDFVRTQDNKDLVNSIFKLDLSSLIAEIPDQFPFGWLKNRIPQSLYLSSTVEVVKGAQPFSYTVLHNAITINALSQEDTEELLDTLDKLLDSGSAKEFNELIGQTIMDAMVGNEDKHGVAYSLSTVGATDFNFVYHDGDDYFEIVRG